MLPLHEAATIATATHRPILKIHVLTATATCFSLLLHRIPGSVPAVVDVGDMNTDLKLRGVKRRLESSAAAAAAAGLRVKHLNSGHHRHRAGSPVLLTSSSSSSPTPTPLSAKVLSSTTLESLSLSKIRQLVFNLSMCKLSRYRQTADPSLVRSVLICNTLKRLERELDREGIRINFGPNGVSFAPSTSGNFATTTSTSLLLNGNNSSSTPAPTSPAPHLVQAPPSPLPQSQTSDDIRPIPSPLEPRLQESQSPASFSPEESSPSGRLTPFVREDEVPVDPGVDVQSDPMSSCDEEDDDSGLWSPEPVHNLSSSSWSETEMSFSSVDLTDESTIEISCERLQPQPEHSVPLLDTTSSILIHELQPPISSEAEKVVVCEDEASSLKQAARCSKSSIHVSLSSSSCPTSSSSSITTTAATTTTTATTEEIFGDIDLSLYDFDLLSPIAAPHVKMTPVSAEELIRSITPTTDSSSPVPASTSVQSPSSMTTCATLASSPSNTSPCPPSTSCATQSSSSVVFSKLFTSKKDPLFMDEMPTAIS